MRRFGVTPAKGEAVLHGGLKANGMTALASVDAGFHFAGESVHGRLAFGRRLPMHLKQA
jgi:hypothetical protein